MSQALARAYLEGSPVVLPMCAVRALVSAAYRRTRGYVWAPVEVDPYGSALEMSQRATHEGRLRVWTGASEGLPWEPVANWTMRAAHDRDHIERGLSFTLDGERHAARVAAERMPGLAWFYASEVLGQAAVATVTGSFAPQKVVRSRTLTRALAV